MIGWKKGRGKRTMMTTIDEVADHWQMIGKKLMGWARVKGSNDGRIGGNGKIKNRR